MRDKGDKLEWHLEDIGIHLLKVRGTHAIVHHKGESFPMDIESDLKRIYPDFHGFSYTKSDSPRGT